MVENNKCNKERAGAKGLGKTVTGRKRGGEGGKRGERISWKSILHVGTHEN